MSDFYGCLSSTSFRVKDREAFLADPDIVLLRKHIESEGGFWEDGTETNGYFSFGWYGQYPEPVLSIDLGDDDEQQCARIQEIDIAVAIQRHILPGDCCKLGVSGNEKLRYIGGGLTFITSQGIAFYNAQTSWEEHLSTEKVVREFEEFLADLRKIA